MNGFFIGVTIAKRIAHLITAAFDEDHLHAGGGIGKGVARGGQFPIHAGAQTAGKVLKNVPAYFFAPACLHFAHVPLHVQFRGFVSLAFHSECQIHFRFSFLPFQVVGDDQTVPLLPGFFVFQLGGKCRQGQQRGEK